LQAVAKNSSIGWTDHTVNFWWGCDKVSQECRHCYIAPIMRRGGYEPFKGPVRTKGEWKKPPRYDRECKRAGIRKRVFSCSMSDFFHPGANDWRGEAWGIIRRCDSLDWLLLTKRPDLIPDCLPPDWGEGYSNVWLGVTAGCAKSLWRLDVLNGIPAVLKFVSAEPLLERMDFRPYLPWLGWVITGCERAVKKKRRVMDLDWVRAIDGQCKEFGVPHFFKQAHVNEREKPLLDGRALTRVGRLVGGNLGCLLPGSATLLPADSASPDQL
jgi:protein gp37